MLWKKKIITFGILFLILILNLTFYFSGSESKKNKLLPKNQVFQAEIEQNSSNEIDLIIKNDIDNLNKRFNFSIPNFSVFLFDIESNSIEWINEISNLIFFPKFGFKTINKNFLDEAKNLNIQNLYVRVFIKNSSQTPYSYSDSIANDQLKLSLSEIEPKEIFFSPNYFPEENKQVFENLVNLKKEYSLNFYIHEEDLVFLDGNSDLINLIIELKPILVSSSIQSCASKHNLCFFSKNYSIDSILEKVSNLKNEIINNKIKKKNVLLGFSVDREDISILDFVKKIKDIIYSGKIYYE